jgi:hypothetical protein
VVGFFYKKLQYRGTAVDYEKANKRQPVPKSLDVLKTGAEPVGRYLPPDHRDEGAKVEE